MSDRRDGRKQWGDKTPIPPLQGVKRISSQGTETEMHPCPKSNKEKPQGMGIAKAVTKKTLHRCHRCHCLFPSKKEKKHHEKNKEEDCPKYKNNKGIFDDILRKVRNSPPNNGNNDSQSSCSEDEWDAMDPEWRLTETLRKIIAETPTEEELGYPGLIDLEEGERRRQEWLLPENVAARKRGETPNYSWDSA